MTHWLDGPSYKGNSNLELGTAICYINVENYFLTIIKHIAVPSSKLEFPFHYAWVESRNTLIFKNLYLHIFCKFNCQHLHLPIFHCCHWIPDQLPPDYLNNKFEIFYGRYAVLDTLCSIIDIWQVVPKTHLMGMCNFLTLH